MASSRALNWKTPWFATGGSSHARMSVSSLDYLLSFAVQGLILLVLVSSYPDLMHWFVLPVLVAGTLIGVDAVLWFTGRVQLFDPAGILGVLGVHFFFLAPLLHIVWNTEMPYINDIPSDWRQWFGIMGLLNCAGIIVYQQVRRWIERRPGGLSERVIWRIDPPRFYLVVGLLALVSLSLQVWVYAQYSGITGFIVAFEEGQGAFANQGWIFAISESFPILVALAFAVKARKSRWARNWFVLLGVLLILLILKVFFGGLRGSRSNTIWGVFWAAGIFHFVVRPLPRRAVFVGLAVLVGFMYVWGFYKTAGLEGLASLRESETRSHFENESNRDIRLVLLADFARADVQAYLAYLLLSGSSDFQYALGRTYLGALALTIPRSVWPARPPSKVKEGTEVQYGAGSYSEDGPDKFYSSRVYGLSGEVMLNFTPFAVPVGFGLLGAFIGWLRRSMTRLPANDARWLLVPFSVIISFCILQADSDNLLFLILKDGTIPFLAVVLGSTRQVQVDPAPIAALGNSIGSSVRTV